MKNFIALLALLFAAPAFASPCDQFFPNGKEIVVKDTQVVCKNFYAIVWDTKHVANIFSTEASQPKVSVPRKDAFRADPAVANSPTPDDYTNTGFDRGHMVAAANSASPEQMSETFFMTNMTPQYPNVNRIAWRLLEASVRDMPFAYIVTGAVYSPDFTPTIGTRKVAVPTHLYKVVYLKDGTIKAFMIKNAKEEKAAAPVDVAVIETQTGIKFR